MGNHIVIIQGNPDPGPERFGRALAAAYQRGAEQSGKAVRIIDVAHIEFALLRSKDEWQSAKVPAAIRESQETINWADHLVIIYPLWLGDMPALLKAFLEQVLRPGFAFDASQAGMWKKRLTGKSARVIVTMGMPGFAYRWFFLAHSLKSLQRNILHFCGIRPVRTSVIGMVEASSPDGRNKWLAKLEAYGRDGS